MARIVRDRKTPRVNEQEEIRRVRGRYAQALELGHSMEEAAKFAHGEGPIPAPKVEKRKDPLKAVASEPPAKTETVSLSGGGAKKQPTEKDSVEIPPSWEDLPWPELSALAEKISGTSVKSRRAANEIIWKEIVANEGDEE